MVDLIKIFRRRRYTQPTPTTIVSCGKGSSDFIICYQGVNYRGTCTVWHNADSGRRCTTSMESRFCDIWTKEQWRLEAETKSMEDLDARWCDSSVELPPKIDGQYVIFWSTFDGAILSMWSDEHADYVDPHTRFVTNKGRYWKLVTPPKGVE